MHTHIHISVHNEHGVVRNENNGRVSQVGTNQRREREKSSERASSPYSPTAPIDSPPNFQQEIYTLRPHRLEFLPLVSLAFPLKRRSSLFRHTHTPLQTYTGCVAENQERHIISDTFFRSVVNGRATFTSVRRCLQQRR